MPGGRYRVRAFLAPVYAQTSAEVRFLTDGEEHTFDLRSRTSAASSCAPTSPPTSRSSTTP